LFFVIQILSVLVALSSAAPSHLLAGAGYGAVGYGAIGYEAIAAPLTAVHETVHAGPAVSETVVHHGVVGSRTVQVSSNKNCIFVKIVPT
jgi:hypothetical protein